MNEESSREQHDDVTIEPEDTEVDGFGRSNAEKKLREELKKCRKEKQEYLLGWQRAKADLVNRNREIESERQKIRDRVTEEILSDIIDVLDSFSMAFSDTDAWEKVDEGWRRGIEHIHSQFLSILKSYGLEEIDPTGEEFDPREHDALESIDTDSKDKDGMIESVVRKGYRLNDTVIRPARVRIYESR